jgi:hypothetical protein
VLGQKMEKALRSLYEKIEKMERLLCSKGAPEGSADIKNFSGALFFASLSGADILYK